jgi:hypothetical protein
LIQANIAMRKISLLFLLLWTSGWLHGQTAGDPPGIPASLYEIKMLQFFENDGGLSNVNSVPGFQCDNTIMPAVEIENDGSNALTSASLEYYVDANSPQTIEWNGWLEPGAVDTLNLPAISVPEGEHKLTISLVQANGAADINIGNNDNVINFYIVGSSTAAPLYEKFDDSNLPNGYFVGNEDDGPTWTIYQSEDESGPLNYMLQMHFYYSLAGNADEFYLKNLDLSNVSGAYLDFDLAYKYYSNQGVEYFDELQVQVSSDCGENWTVLYDKSKDDLATLPPDDIEFFVSDEAAWRTESISLCNYAGNQNLMIRFQAISGHGNNLYIDNISIASLTGIDSPEGDKISLEIFPNPSSSLVSIRTNSTFAHGLRLSILNLLGQECYSSELTGNSPVEINVSSWQSNLYFANIYNNGTLAGSSKFEVAH